MSTIPVHSSPILRIAGIALAVIALAGTVLLVTSHGPGDSPRGLQAKALGNRVVQGLAAFKRLNGHYPERFEDMQGTTVLSRNDLEELRTSQDPAFEYRLDGEAGYALSFEYHGPGTNRCTYAGGTDGVTWTCSRHY